MESFARGILNNAQTLYDGGVIKNILKNVNVFNNSNAAAESKSYLISLRMSGGYVAGLLFGILWFLSMILSMSYFFYMHFRRGDSQFDHSRILKPLKWSKIKNGKVKPYSSATILQLFAIGAIVIPVLLLTCLSVVNIVYLSNSISSPATNYDQNKTEEVTAILPAFKKSLVKVKNYLSTFSDKARINTEPIVEEIVEATKKLQNETMTLFNDVLMSRIGVTQTFQYADEMTAIVVKLFEHSTVLLQEKRDFQELHEQFFPAAMDPDFSVFELIRLVRESIAQISVCDDACKDLKRFFDKKFISENSFADTDFASSFLFIMKQQNETVQSVIEQSVHGRQQMSIAMEKSKQRMESLVDIPATVRNMTVDTWKTMDKGFQKAVFIINKIIRDVDGKVSSEAALRISLILAIVLSIPLVFIVMVVAFTVVLVCIGARNSRLRLTVYASLALLSLCLIAATVAFLVGGQVETEFCRYLRTEQPIFSDANGTSRLALDDELNHFFSTNMYRIKNPDFPTPVPKNALYGLIHRCRHNEPILAAINAINSLNSTSLSKPEASAKMIDVGRMILIESLMSTDPMKMIPSNMQNSLAQASQMDMFKHIDFDANIAKISYSPINEKRGNISVSVPTSVFIDHIESFIENYGSLMKDQRKNDRLKQSLKVILPQLEKYGLVTDNARNVYRTLRDIPAMEPIVKKMQSSLKTMISLMTNKTELLTIANKYYDEIIVRSTPNNAAKIMKNFGPKMMSKIGHCRPLFEAYHSIVDTGCDVVVSKLNSYWLYLGTIVLLVTIFLATVLITVARTTPWFESASLDHIDLNNADKQHRLLRDPRETVKDIDDGQRRTML